MKELGSICGPIINDAVRIVGAAKGWSEDRIVAEFEIVIKDHAEDYLSVQGNRPDGYRMKSWDMAAIYLSALNHAARFIESNRLAD